MPVYQMKAPDGKVYRITGPEGATPDQVKAEIIRQNPSLAGPKPAPAIKPKDQDMIPERTFLGAVQESPRNILSSGAKQIGGLFDMAGQLASSARTGEFPQFITDLTDVAGGYIAKAIPEQFIKDPQAAEQLIAKADAFGGAMKNRYGSYQALLNTIATDPVGFAADVSTLFGGTAGIAKRAGVGEAVTGPLQKAATYTDPFAPLAPAVALTARGTARAAGAVRDIAGNRLAELQAARIARGAAGNKLPEILAATQAAPEGITAAQSIADTGIDATQFMALEEVAKSVNPDAYREIYKLQGQDRIDALARIAGGYTSAQSKAAQAAEKASLSGITDKMREQAVRKAGKPGRVMPRLEEIASGAREASARAVENVRRWENAVNKADDWARNWAANRGVGEPGVRLPERVLATTTFPGQLAASGRQTTIGGPFERQVIDEGGVVAQRIQQEAAKSVSAGEKARQAEALLAQIKEQNLKPLQTGEMISSLTAKLAKPEIKLNNTTRRSIERVAEMLRDWTNENGIITPDALIAIRKHGVSGVIEDLMPQASSKARRKATQAALLEIKPMIDKAMRDAGGGDDWVNYLKTFEVGMRGIERKELARRALELYRRNPADYVKLIEGNDIRTIEKVFGPGSYDIAKEMGTDFATLRDVAAGVKRELDIADQASAGLQALKETILESGSSFRMPAFLSAKAAITNKVLEGVEGYLSQGAVRKIAEAMKSGKSANELLRSLPTADRDVLLLELQDSKAVQDAFRRVAPKITAATAVQAKVEEGKRNALSKQQNSNALATR